MLMLMLILILMYYSKFKQCGYSILNIVLIFIFNIYITDTACTYKISTSIICITNIRIHQYSITIGYSVQYE